MSRRTVSVVLDTELPFALLRRVELRDGRRVEVVDAGGLHQLVLCGDDLLFHGYEEPVAMFLARRRFAARR